MPPETPGTTEGGEKSGMEALKEIKIEVESKPQGISEKRKRGRPPKNPPASPQPSQDDLKKEVEDLSEMILGFADSFCQAQGLTALNPIQRLMIKTGLVGTAMKYNLNLADQPEIMLIGGIAWVGLEKYAEFKKLPKKAEGKEKEEENKEATVAT